MTIAECKRELPDVRVRFMGKVWIARVSGRLNQFASVSPYIVANPRNRSEGTRIIGPIYHFAWDIVARAASENRVLTVD